MEYIVLIGKCVLFYLIIVVALRLMGKREVGELSVLDIVIYFVMSELLALSISEQGSSIFQAITAIITLTILQIFISWLLLRMEKVRDLFEGEPVILIKNGKIQQETMKKQRYTIDDLFYQLRDKEVSTIDEVKFAILENSGTLSILTVDKCMIQYPFPLISDGKIQYKALEDSNHTEDWLIQQVKKQGYHDVKDIFIGQLEKEHLTLIPKQTKQTKRMHKGSH